MRLNPVCCVECGKFLSNAEMVDGTARHSFEPLNEYGPEVSEWICANCVEVGAIRKERGNG